MDTGEIKGMHFIAIPASGYGDRCCKHCDMEFRIRCRSALDGLETLLQSLLEISKMETGLIQMNKKKLPLIDTVISAVNRTYPKADEKRSG